MKTGQKTWTTKKLWDALNSKRISKESWDSDVIVTKKSVKTPENDVSVFTKTTNPRVVVKSENLNDEWNISLQKCCCKCKVLKFLCFAIMCIIILMTFFLALKTYNTVNELANYILM